MLSQCSRWPPTPLYGCQTVQSLYVVGPALAFSPLDGVCS